MQQLILEKFAATIFLSEKQVADVQMKSTGANFGYGSCEIDGAHYIGVYGLGQ